MDSSVSLIGPDSYTIRHADHRNIVSEKFHHKTVSYQMILELQISVIDYRLIWGKIYQLCTETCKIKKQKGSWWYPLILLINQVFDLIIIDDPKKFGNPTIIKYDIKCNSPFSSIKQLSDLQNIFYVNINVLCLYYLPTTWLGFV